jgi:hypothetical protein
MYSRGSNTGHSDRSQSLHWLTYQISITVTKSCSFRERLYSTYSFWPQTMYFQMTAVRWGYGSDRILEEFFFSCLSWWKEILWPGNCLDIFVYFSWASVELQEWCLEQEPRAHTEEHRNGRITSISRKLFSTCPVVDQEYFNDVEVQLLHYWNTNLCSKANHTTQLLVYR